MRAVNLIPAEERRAVRGQGAGPSLATKLLLGGLGAAVLAVTVLVLVSNQINSKQEELAKLESKQQNAVAATEALRPYGEFVTLQAGSLHHRYRHRGSRFNWERVVRQLSRVVPPKVWIMEFKGTVTRISLGRRRRRRRWRRRQPSWFRSGPRGRAQGLFVDAERLRAPDDRGLEFDLRRLLGTSQYSHARC